MTESSRPKALLFGVASGTMAPIPSLLSRAGFAVTAVTSAREMASCLNLAAAIIVDRAVDVIPRVIDEAAKGYDMFIPADDAILLELRNADIPLELKLKLLPINSARALDHIGSKIGLSRALDAGGVPTPAYAVARTRADLGAAIAELGYPVMLKSDFGSGGVQVRRLGTSAALDTLSPDFEFPALVQRALEGDLMDYSGFYKQGRLVHFSEALVLASERGGTGPSYLRRYTTHPTRDVVLQLQRLGEALDADGFANVSAIRTLDGGIHFFEADMRPNGWVEYPARLGNDPAVAIGDAFGLKSLSVPQVVPPAAYVQFALGRRMSVWQILLNQHNCRSDFVDYLGRGLIRARVRRSIERLTLRRLNNAIRALIGLPPRKSRRRNSFPTTVRN